MFYVTKKFLKSTCGKAVYLLYLGSNPREREKMKAIYFDMDGTIYDLYNVDNWLSLLENEDETAYSCGKSLYDMVALNALLEKFVSMGVTIGVITWGAMNGSKEFGKRTLTVRQAAEHQTFH